MIRIVLTPISALAVLFGLAAGLYVSDAVAAASDLIHVGRAKVVVRDVNGQIGNEPAKRISIDQRLFYDQRIITTDNSRSVVEFRDGSLLQVGPDAVIILNKFVFNPFESKSEKVLTAVRGSFRYISGIKTRTSGIEIRTPNATIGIRGSQGDFLIHPASPDFFALGDGIATVRNSRGSVNLRPGQAIAVTGRDAPLPQPQQIPPAVTAQVLRHIARRVGPPPPRRAVAPLPAAEARIDAAANQVSAGDQEGQQNAAQAAPPPPAPSGGPPPDDVDLLTRAAAVGLLNKDPGAPLTSEQASFISQANQAIPDAAARIQAAVREARAQTTVNGDRSTREIIKTTTEFGAGPDAAKNLVSAAAGADPQRAVIVATSALDGAPDKAVEIAEAATRAAAPAAAGIAGGLAAKNPDAAAAIAAAVAGIAKASAPAVAASVARALPASQRTQVIAAVVAAVPEQRTRIEASLQPQGGQQGQAGNAGNAGNGQSPPAGPGAGNPPAGGAVSQELLAGVVAGDPAALAAVRSYIAAGGDEEIVARAKEIIAQVDAQKGNIGTEALLKTIDRLASEAINLVSGSQMIRMGIDDDYVPTKAVIALDFGPPDGDTAPGFERVQPGDPRIAGVALEGLRRPSESALLNDGLRGVQRIEVDLPDGEYRVILMTQDLGDRSLIANPFGTEISVNGVSQSLSQPSPDFWVPGGVFTNRGASSLLSQASTEGGSFLTGELGDTSAIQRQQGGALIINAVVRNGKLIVELDGFTNAQSYLTGLIVEPVAETSELVLSQEAARTLRPPQLRLALEEEILAAAAEVLADIDPAAGDPELVELPEPILDPEELASTSQ